MSLPRPIVILGPTAGGKSDLAIALAERCAAIDGRPGQVLSADSMQVYRHMDSGTAKPSPAERTRVVHHLIDIVEPTERFTVSDWLARADTLIESLQREGVRPIIVGGTNLYLKGLLEGMFEGPPADAALREALSQVDTHELHARLKAVDPLAAERIHPNDRKRLTRALEVYEATGQMISALQTQWRERDEASGFERAGDRLAACPQGRASAYRHNPILVGLHWDIDDINRRINLRVKAMFYPDKARQQDGVTLWPGVSLIDETRRLEDAGLLGAQARAALGYKQVLESFAGRLTEDEAFERTKIETRRFARNQRTWLKRFTNVHWLDASALSAAERIEAAIALLQPPAPPRGRDGVGASSVAPHRDSVSHHDEFRPPGEAGG